MPEDIVLPGGGGGAGVASGGNIHFAGASPATFSADAFVTRRGDHLGLTLVRRRALLALELPQGTNVYVGFFTQMPSRIGEGGTEVSVSGYARQAIASWVTATEGASARRTNAVALTWDPFVTAATVVGWGIWSALTNGTLRDFDFLRTADGDPITHTIAAGWRPGLAAGDIGLVL